MQSRAQKKAQNMVSKIDMAYTETKKTVCDGLIDGKPIVTGHEKLVELVKDENVRITWVARHHSEFDFIALQKFFYNLGINLPSILGGNNLLVAGLTETTKYIKKPLIIDLNKCNLFSIDRNLMQEDSEDSKEYKSIFRENVSNTYNSGNFLVFYSGRTYSGEKKDYDGNFPMLTKTHQNKNSKLKHLIIPVELNYERVIEDIAFSIEHKIKTKTFLGNIINPSKKIRGKLSAIVDILSFILQTQQNKGEIYIDFGKAITVKTKSIKEIKTEINKSLRNMVRITPTSLVAKVLSETESPYISPQELTDKIDNARTIIYNNNHPVSTYLNEIFTNEEVINRSKLFLSDKRLKKVIRNTWWDKNVLEINQESSLIKFYANMFGHYSIK